LLLLRAFYASRIDIARLPFCVPSHRFCLQDCACTGPPLSCIAARKTFPVFWPGGVDVVVDVKIVATLERY
jgi:hypothetical protein